MSSPETYPRVVDIAYCVCIVMYVSIAVLGYLMYGDTTRPEITLNIIAQAGQGNMMIATIARLSTVLIIVSPITKFGLTINPIALMLEEAILPRALERAEL